jgi:hypothetical protein
MRDNKDLKAGFENCGNAVICVFPGQYYSDLPSHGDTVFHYNLGIDVVNVKMVTETVDYKGLPTINCPPDIGCSECSDVEECPHANPCWEPTVDDDGGDIDNEGMPPCLPRATDDQEFIVIGHELQHLECQKLGLENMWADLAARCTYKTTNPEDDTCALSFGARCLFDKCKRI